MGTIIGSKVYIIQYYADASTYDNYLRDIQRMIASLKITRPSGAASGNNNSVSDGAGGKKHYIGLDYDAWQADPINVYIVVDEATKKQSSKYLNDAKAAINKWSEILKQKSGNEKA
jgi:hypothetical protein